MQAIAKILLLSLGLVSCATSEDSRYRDTRLLERPPILAAGKKAGEQQETDNSTVSSIENTKTDLNAKVYMTSSTPPLLIIKQPYDMAWDTLGQALKQSYMTISDREHDKGLYFVTYDPDKQAAEEGNFLDKTMSFIMDENIMKETTY